MKKNKRFTVQVKVDAIVGIEINAASLEEGLAEAKAELGKLPLWAAAVEVFDTSEEVTGIY